MERLGLKLKRSRFLVLSLLLLFLVPGYAQNTKLTIYCTNDIHGHILKEKRDSIIDITYVASLKKNAKNPCLLVDAGDLAYGMPIADARYISDLADLLNMAGYDAATLGNHDFDGGMDELRKRISKSKYPYVSANIFKRKTSEYYLSEFSNINGSGNSIVKEINGIKVGIFGLTTAKSECAKTIEVIDFKSDTSGRDYYVEIAREQVTKLRKDKKADIVIALCHLGKPNHTDKILEEVEGLDVIIDGDSHQEYVNFCNQFKRVLIQAGTGAQKVGEIILNINKNKEITKIDARLLSFSDIRNIKIDKNIAQKEKTLRDTLDQTYGALNYQLEESFWGSSVTYLKGEKEEVDAEPNRLTQTMLGKLWCYIMLDAYHQWAKNELQDIKGHKMSEPLPYQPWVVLKNGGSLRAGLPQGIVTGYDLFQMCPNNAVVVAVKISFGTLYQILSNSLNCINIEDSIRKNTQIGSGRFLQWKGITVDYDPVQKKGHFVFSNRPYIQTIPIEKNNNKDSCMLITTQYVLDDISYGKIKTKDKPIELGTELDLMKVFFNEYYDPPSFEHLPTLVEWLRTDLEVYEFNTEECIPKNQPYTPKILLQYKNLIDTDVTYTITSYDHSLNEYMDIKYVDVVEAGELMVLPRKCIGPITIEIECDARIKASDGKILYKTLYGSTYLDPIIGCGDKFPAVIKLKER